MSLGEMVECSEKAIWTRVSFLWFKRSFIEELASYSAISMRVGAYRGRAPFACAFSSIFFSFFSSFLLCPAPKIIVLLSSFLPRSPILLSSLFAGSASISLLLLLCLCPFSFSFVLHLLLPYLFFFLFFLPPPSSTFLLLFDLHPPDLFSSSSPSSASLLLCSFVFLYLSPSDILSSSSSFFSSSILFFHCNHHHLLLYGNDEVL